MHIGSPGGQIVQGSPQTFPAQGMNIGGGQIKPMAATHVPVSSHAVGAIGGTHIGCIGGHGSHISPQFLFRHGWYGGGHVGPTTHALFSSHWKGPPIPHIGPASEQSGMHASPHVFPSQGGGGGAGHMGFAATHTAPGSQNPGVVSPGMVHATPQGCPWQAGSGPGCVSPR
jgi:hypothetical protein